MTKFKPVRGRENIRITVLIMLFLVVKSQQSGRNNFSQSSNQISEFQFLFKSHMIPHPDKAHRGGEDAYYNSTRMLVVADGVGGWNNQGIDPSKYSRFLCAVAEQYNMDNQNNKMFRRNPREVIRQAQQQNNNVGSATMVVVTLQDKLLRYCYLGDSGLMVIRKFNRQQRYLSIYEFVQQQHSFNFPYQLAMEKYGGDSPDHSICGTLQVQVGDIVVVGSDGLFDNIDFYQILENVRNVDAAGVNVVSSDLATTLAELAIKRGKNQKFNSPFAKRAKRQKLNYMGGKLDDTTIIIAQITQKNNQIIVQL